MATPYIGEVKIVSFGFAPKNWTQCNGQLLPINQNQALFSLLGTTYGGNGQTTFALPNMQGRVPIHVGAGFVQGQAAGEVAHTVTTSEMPAHNHFVNATTNKATTATPSASLVLAQSTGANLYAAASNATPMDPRATSNVGGSQPHSNQQPYLVLNFCIALQGIFPSRN
jgi:microcystin-dependent protein